MLSVPLTLEKSGSELGWPAKGFRCSYSGFLAYFWGLESLSPQKGKPRPS